MLDAVYRSQSLVEHESCTTIRQILNCAKVRRSPPLLSSKALIYDLGILVYAEVLCSCGIS